MKIALALHIIVCVMCSGCSEYARKEYFCEGYTQIQNDQTFGQNGVRINIDEICITYLGRDYDKYSCIRFGMGSVEEWGAVSGSDGQVDERRSFSATMDSGKAIVEVRKQERPSKPELIERKLINNNWNFFYKKIPLNLTLPKATATAETLATFDLYAVSNVVYWGGRMIKEPYTKELQDILGLSDQKSYGVGGSTYQAYHGRANNSVEATYSFDPSRLTLSYESKETSRRYGCEVWRKQRWWEL